MNMEQNLWVKALTTTTTSPTYTHTETHIHRDA